ncbi:MAG: hypothetical protein V4634_04110 [Pseudomonadota bacterium]
MRLPLLVVNLISFPCGNPMLARVSFMEATIFENVFLRRFCTAEAGVCDAVHGIKVGKARWRVGFISQESSMMQTQTLSAWKNGCQPAVRIHR